MNRNAPNQRPVISLGLSPVLVTVELLAAIAILLAVLLIVQFWAVLPDRIPIHFGDRGLADAGGGCHYFCGFNCGIALSAYF